MASTGHAHQRSHWSLIALLLFLCILFAALGAFIASLSGTTNWKPLVLAPTEAQKLAAANTHPDPAALDATLAADMYLNTIQPIFNARCIACHGCLNSPCLLKLTSYWGLSRGARNENPDGEHIWPESPVRLNDAPTVRAWRQRGFHDVVNTQPGLTREERLADSELYTLVAAGKSPGFDRKAIEPLYRRRDRHECPCENAAVVWLKKFPYGGMPFGLPRISNDSFTTLTDWIGNGASGPTVKADAALETIRHPQAVAKWEAFLNQDDPRSPLVSRYLYEHSFLARIAIDGAPGEVFQIVRSATPPGQAITEIVTSRPYDNPFFDPKVKRFWYRLHKTAEPYVQKSHFLWTVDDAAMARLKELFFGPDWEPSPGADRDYTEVNPFVVYRDIPAMSRARFMLENSKLIITGMIQGPVCIGKTATYAIKDYFWIFYMDPKVDPSVLDPELGLRSWKAFMDYSVWSNAKYEAAYAKMLDFYKLDQYSVEDIWDGNQTDPNAWLTVLRNETNATVLYGRRGGIPPTFWIIDYSGFERLYYSLVVMYTYWGGVEEKVATWTFMTFLRQEFEDNFLRLLPPDEREQYREKWTQGLGSSLLAFMPFPGENLGADEKIEATNPISNVLTQIQRRLTDKVSGPPDPLNPSPDAKPDINLDHPVTSFPLFEAAISTQTMITGKVGMKFMPSIVFLKVNDDSEGEPAPLPETGPELARQIARMNLDLKGSPLRAQLTGDHGYRLYTLIANRAYKFNDVIFDQNGAYEWELNTLSVYRGLVGDFPNNFIEINLSQTGDFVKEFAAIQDEDGWIAWKTKYATLRNQEKVWHQLDFFNAWNYANRGLDAGYYDMTYYDLFDGVY